MLVYLAGDLFWGTRIKSAAEDLGIPCRPVRTPEMLEARLADSPVKAALLDLDAGEVALGMIARLRGPGTGESGRRVRVVAFGPHVAKDLFQRARDAGADEVLTRGAIEHRLGEVLLQLCPPGGVPGGNAGGVA
ncbi:MAG: hypothetical protein HRU70_01215 [Phycisphaeraceae bacterium]|nr:MAG: hypothetical protein HRU70_01215 [Phycisphaeraceae bacterium]